MKTIISESKQVHENAARRIKALLDEKPDAVIAFSAGRSMTGLFALLREMSARREVCFSAARVLAVTEFISAPPALTCRAQLERELLDPVGTVSGNRYFPSEENFRDYDALIASLGGIDLASTCSCSASGTTVTSATMSRAHSLTLSHVCRSSRLPRAVSLPMSSAERIRCLNAPSLWV